jgi:short-subunit dehydrogenase
LKDRYGPWALVAGASEGIGAAFATTLSRQGLNVVLVARREGPLHDLAERLATDTRVVPADLATPEGVSHVVDGTNDLDIGLVVSNAAYSPIGLFIDRDPADLDRVLDLNCRALLRLARAYLPAMVERGRGGLVIMSSLSGMQGTATIATYAASKAFGAVLAEGLWAELKPTGVDVVACVAGAVATPGYDRALAKRAPGTVEPQQVVSAALRALGRRPRAVPGAMMRVSAALMARVLPRRTAIGVVSRATANLEKP